MVDQRVDNIMLPCVTHATLLHFSLAFHKEFLEIKHIYGFMYPPCLPESCST